jgi:hypothetical protein
MKGMHQLDARYRNGRIPEALKVGHCIDPGLDVAMILPYQIVQILRPS